MTSISHSILHKVVPITTIIFFSCNQTILPPYEISESNHYVERSLDSLQITFISGWAIYDALPEGSKPSLSVDIIICNRSANLLDSLLIVQGAALNKTSDSTFMRFQFTSVFNLNQGHNFEDWSGRLQPGQIDSIHCGFTSISNWSLKDSFIVRIQIHNRHTQTKYFDTPILRYYQYQ